MKRYQIVDSWVVRTAGEADQNTDDTLEGAQIKATEILKKYPRDEGKYVVQVMSKVSEVRSDVNIIVEPIELLEKSNDSISE